jgi:hypothetical protein
MNEAVSLPKVTLDRSRDHATVHGERGPDDRHHGVRFFQEGLPFNGEGVLIHDHPDIASDPKLQKLVERKLKKAAAMEARAAQPKADSDDDDDETGEGDDLGGTAGDKELPPVDLRLWVMGQQDVVWNDVSQAIAHRFKVRVGSKKHAVELLVAEGVVQPQMVAKDFQKYLD